MRFHPLRSPTTIVVTAWMKAVGDDGGEMATDNTLPANSFSSLQQQIPEARGKREAKERQRRGEERQRRGEERQRRGKGEAKTG